MGCITNGQEKATLGIGIRTAILKEASGAFFFRISVQRVALIIRLRYADHRASRAYSPRCKIPFQVPLTDSVLLGNPKRPSFVNKTSWPSGSDHRAREALRWQYPTLSDQCVGTAKSVYSGAIDSPLGRAEATICAEGTWQQSRIDEATYLV